MGESEGDFQFHLAEYGKLKDEIISLQEIENDVLKYCILSAAAAAAFIFSLPFEDDIGVALSSLIVPTLSLLFYFYFESLEATIAGMGQYLRKIEERYAHEDMGWERFLDSHSLGYWLSVRFLFITVFVLGLLFSAYVLLMHFGIVQQWTSALAPR